ncbi:MAG: pilus assembly protein [Alphaproteobacteria bacterium]|nr:pilus assembly protein [Alphaproteobacteria bacterium]
MESGTFAVTKWRRPIVDDGGATAVELALVMPFAMMLLLGIIHFGALLYLQNTMTSIANDVVRRVAVDDLTGPEGVAEAQARLASWNATFAVTVNEPTPDEIQIMISVPTADAAIIDLGDFMTEDDLMAQASMRKE